MTTQYLLAIDQGTTNSRAIIFNREGQIVSLHEVSLSQSFPQSGWVEQRPEEIFANSVLCCQEALKKANLTAKNIAGIGITNQRETTIIWDKNTGQSIYPAIVWQDRRTSDICHQLSKTNLNTIIQHKTGLLLDSYFSATKISWILDHVEHARSRAEKGELLFGTIDTYLLWKLTEGQSHATDASNASRTLLFNIHTQSWDDELLAAFNIPKNILPIVMDNTAHFGDAHEAYFGSKIPILGMAGDQQAATIGQACFQPGMIKTTYGTGCFMVLNTGSEVIQSQNQLISTVLYRIKNKTTYALEGSTFCAGATMKWLRDMLKLFTHTSQTEPLAKSVADTNGVYLVPAFSGLGAPYWDPGARGALLGLTQNCGVAHVVRAALESVGYQTRDLLLAMMSDHQTNILKIRVDGGMVANNWLLQFLADILNVTVERPICIETTALGAAFLAGLQAGVYASLDEISALWQQNALYESHMPEVIREDLYQGWQKAVKRVRTNTP